MTPAQLAAASSLIHWRWPDAEIAGRYANSTITLDVVVDNMIVAWVNFANGAVHPLHTPVPVDRNQLQIRQLDP